MNLIVDIIYNVVNIDKSHYVFMVLRLTNYHITREKTHINVT